MREINWKTKPLKMMESFAGWPQCLMLLQGKICHAGEVLVLATHVVADKVPCESVDWLFPPEADEFKAGRHSNESS